MVCMDDRGSWGLRRRCFATILVFVRVEGFVEGLNVAEIEVGSLEKVAWGW